MQTNNIMTRLERSLWANRTLILLLAGAILALRHWTTRSVTVLDATYSVAEMLINYASGFVRRGLSGEIIMWLPNTFGGPPSLWANGVSCVVGIMLFAITLRIYARIPDAPSLLPIVLAPWGLMFLVYDPDVMIRKEVFGYLALGAVLLGTLSVNRKRSMLGLIFACLFMPIAILLHEVNGVFAGSLLIATMMFVRAHPSRRNAVIGWVAFSVCASMISFGAAALHQTGDPRVMCDAVGFAECEDPFRYFSNTAMNGVALISQRIPVHERLIAVGLVVLSALPFLGFRLSGRSSWWLVGIATLIAVPVVPLFAVALDYGRWIVLIFLPASLLAVAALAQGWITYRRVLSPTLAVLYCGTWSFYHWEVVPQLYALMLWPMLASLSILRVLYGHIWPTRRARKATL